MIRWLEMKCQLGRRKRPVGKNMFPVRKFYFPSWKHEIEDSLRFWWFPLYFDF